MSAAILAIPFESNVSPRPCQRTTGSDVGGIGSLNKGIWRARIRGARARKRREGRRMVMFVGWCGCADCADFDDFRKLNAAAFPGASEVCETQNLNSTL